MKYNTPQTLTQIAELLGAKSVGNHSVSITGHNEIHVVEPGEIVFVDHPKYYDKALNCNATVVLINKEVDCPEGKALLISDDPFRDFNKLTLHFNPFVASDAMIDPSAAIGEGTRIQPGAYVGPGVEIGKNCFIHANAVINQGAVLGNDVIVHSNATIGSEAFYYKKRPSGYDKLITGGRAVLEDQVEIGAGTTIDRGVSGDTRIGEGTKIDNLVHIGHDTVVGEHCLFAAMVAIAGCCVIGNHVTIWGKSTISSDKKVGDNAVILAISAVDKNLEGGKTYFGAPAIEAREAWKEKVKLKRLLKDA